MSDNKYYIDELLVFSNTLQLNQFNFLHWKMKQVA